MQCLYLLGENLCRLLKCIKWQTDRISVVFSIQQPFYAVLLPHTIPSSLFPLQVVTTQPTSAARLPPPPTTWIAWSIFSCLCCAWPCGVMAIIYSMKVNCCMVGCILVLYRCICLTYHATRLVVYESGLMNQLINFELGLTRRCSTNEARVYLYL